MGSLLFITLALVGLIFVMLEFFLPGGVVGTIGMLLFLVSYLFCFQQLETITQMAFATIVYVTVMVSLVRFITYTIKKSKANTIYLSADQEGFLASSFDKGLVGTSGVAISNLSLSGKIEINGKQYPAVSESEYIEAGTMVMVVDGKGGYFIVRRV
ncbi:MAG: hypothetical protein HY860_04365 [Chlamydiales bacterium]|nr:hypothetical protein [Chlamydiales bacterium]